MIVYHKLTAEITGEDGREWVVSVEPPFKSEEGKPVKWEVTLLESLTREELKARNGVNEPFTYVVPCTDGMFKAMSMALDLVPSRYGNG